MTKIALFLLLVLSQASPAQQNTVLYEGKIVFEKRVNLYAINGPVNSEFKKNTDQFRVSRHAFSFSQQNNLYAPFSDNQNLSRAGEQPAENNIVYSENESRWYQSKKKIMQKQFLIQDTLPKISWKITNEKKTIAGFECRRANAVIFDSVYVVAFYADDIPVSSGPELFNGLPGMILGVSLPHQHIHWIATKIENQSIGEDSIYKPGYKLSPISARQLVTEILSDLKGWPNYNTNLIQALL